MFDLIDEWGPEKIVCVSDSRTGMRGVLVIDNTARGMGKGGTRMSTTVSVDEVARLARNMTWKWAGVDLFYGGAKAGICADPNATSKEAVLRSFVRALRNEVPEEYVFGLDVGLTEDDAAIMLDEVGGRGGAVGTPHALGGLPYDQLGVTGHGVAESADAAAQALGLDIKTLSVSIQGFGAVGAATARRLTQLGANVVAVSTSRGGLHNPDGLNVAELLELRDHLGDELVTHYNSAAKPLAPQEELTISADILIPAALQDVIDADLAATLPAKIVVEGANLPSSPQAQQVLFERGITVVPDFIANAGGVVAAAVAMDARYSGIRPATAAVFESISTKLRASTIETLEASTAHSQTTHHVARTTAQHRVREAMRLRGRLPKHTERT
ncbi:Glu/Leu/Phe/Val dehydrogenase dimerization domain-containing protein [Rhodococcus sp. IEGM 1381]|uniref:Glu/Leu/Phe/Val family dehydrogenase n=1 Tax=Rhodococcus sp. IEGM 1381 TaxID=3047085 RepID=UPI0024B7011E|nr:Glu/Leu/Phe/Val dehydrogenase dimerization domain-containing protein [Rhodococcus sp. IEGM 1381]MDI9893667.1 Glu/Leu/Phe/Val dehydrogenase dimerization domain-containing protein [Rhodococcus sp. IEGM 1381]